MSYLEEIDKLIEEEKLKNAEELCWEHKDDEQVTTRLIRVLTMEQKYLLAEEICYKYPNNEEIEKLLISVLIKHGKTLEEKYDEAKELCFKYMEDDIDIKAKYVKILIKEERYGEAEQICKDNIDNIKMLSQLIKIYTKQNRLEEAKKICEEHFEEDSVKSQYVTVLMNEGNLNKAKELCMQYPENIIMQSQLISILMMQGRLDEAKKIAEVNKKSQAVRSQLRFINQKIKIRERREKKGHTFSYKPERKKDEEIIEENKVIEQAESEDKEKNVKEQEEKSFLDIIKTRMYLEDTPREFIEEIQNSNLDDWEKMIAIIAIYKKKNENKNAERVFKEAKRIFKDDQAKCKKLNSLSGYISSNKQKMFDWKMFNSILQWKIDEKYVEDYRAGKLQQQEKIEEQPKKVEVPKLEVIIEESEAKRQGEPLEIKEQKDIVLEDNKIEQKEQEKEEIKENEKQNIVVGPQVQLQIPQRTKKNKNKEKAKNKKEKLKENTTMDMAYRSELTKLKAKISVKANSSNLNYIKEFNAVENLEEKLARDLRAKMQLVMYLRKYGLDKEAKESLPQEYEIYDLINKMMMYKRADPKYNDSKIMEEILEKVSKIDGDNEYIYKLLDNQR